MKTERRLDALRRLDARAADGVERDENGVPTAFRIWRAGSNVTDHGPTIFTDRSAEMLIAEQMLRGNRYSMDVNHLSLDKTAPLENQRAVGFFSLDVRGGDLWAVDCEWTDVVRGGLSKDPPEWKYFSPAYDVDAETGEVVGFLNCALTNTPATHNVTALASRGATQQKDKRMKFAEAMAAMAGDDEEKKEAARAAIKAAFGEEKEEPKKDSADEEEPKKDAAEEEAPDSKKESADDEPSPDSKKDAAVVVASQDKTLRAALARIEALEAKTTDDERKALIAGREMSKSLASTLSKSPLAFVKSVCAGLPPKAKIDLAASAKVSATRGDTQVDGAAAKQTPTEKEAMDVRMGIKRQTASIRHEGKSSTFEVMTREDARAQRAAKKGGS